jgi:hypothetical protein
MEAKRVPVEQTAPLAEAARRGVTVRSVVIALLLVPFNAYWVAMTETVWYAGFPTTISLFYNVVFLVLAVHVLNRLVALVLPKSALTHGELMVIYVVLCLTSTMVSHDMLQVLTPIMTYAFKYATPENQWESLFFRYIPDWLTVNGTIPGFLGGGKSPDVVRLMYEGGTVGTLYRPDIWKAWVVPTGMWTLFCTCLFGMTLGMNSLFRRRWIESERLTFPIVQLPLELTRPGSAMWRSRNFWVAFGVVCAIDLMNGLHVIYPTWPQIPVTSQSNPAFNIGASIQDWPWSALSWGAFWLGFYPFGIGLCLLLPTELALSCWAFYFIFKIMRLLCAIWGISRAEGPPYIEEQSFAGYVGLALFSAWAARGYLRAVVRTVLGHKDIDDSREPMRYRTALLLLVAGYAGAVWMGAAAGMSLWYAAAFFLIYFLLSLAVSRIRAEMGLPAHDLHAAGPGVVLERIIGTRNLSPATLTATEVFCWFNRAYRAHPSPHQIEGFRIAQRTGMNPRPLSWVMGLAIPIGAVSAFWALLHCMYSMGIAAHFMEPKVPKIFGTEPWDRLAATMQNPRLAHGTAGIAIVSGVVVTMAMMALTVRVPWWPLHPAGYAVSSSWAMTYLWCPMLIAWVVKSLVTRYGGNRAYHALVPVAFGLILGDMAGGCAWSVWGLILKPSVAPYCIWGK